MASKQTSSAPLFRSNADLYNDLVIELDDDFYSQLRAANGMNQFLGESANQHDGAPNLGPRSNRVQSGMTSLINSTSPIGSASKANPLGTGIKPGGRNVRSE